jgi:hypothetical protein
MEGWIAGVVIALAVVLVWWVFKPSKKPPMATDARAGSGMRLAERSLDAMTRGLKVSVEDPSLVDRFDFPPFGRGSNRAATEVVQGDIANENVLVFNYSFAVAGERRRREYYIIVLDARFRWTGRLRLTSLPRVGKGPVEFADAWRVDEAPVGVDVTSARLRHALMADRFKASAIVAQPDALVHIQTWTSEEFDLDRDVNLLAEIRAAIAAV